MQLARNKYLLQEQGQRLGNVRLYRRFIGKYILHTFEHKVKILSDKYAYNIWIKKHQERYSVTCNLWFVYLFEEYSKKKNVRFFQKQPPEVFYEKTCS